MALIVLISFIFETLGKENGFIKCSQALLSRHNRLDQDIKAFNGEIKRLDELSVLMTKAASEHNVITNII